MKKIWGLISLLVWSSLFAACGTSDQTNESQKTDQQAEQQEKLQKRTFQELREETDLSKVSLKNIDVSEAEVIIPDVEEMSSVVFPVSTDSLERQVEKFSDNIRKMENMDPDTDLTSQIKIAYWDYDLDDRIMVPLKEATEEQLEGIQYMGYNDGICSSLVVFSNFMLEMGTYQLPVELTEDPEDYSEDDWGYRAVELGKMKAYYRIPENDISGVSYPLAEGEVFLEDAIEYAEKHVKEDYYFVGSKYLDYKVFQVEVRQIKENVYYYEMRLQAYYNGAPIDRVGGVPFEVAEYGAPMSDDPFGTSHRISMFRGDRIDFFWSSCHSYETQNVEAVHTELLSVEDACKCLSEYLAGRNIEVTSIELLYASDFQYESIEKWQVGYIQNIHCYPAYQFKIANAGALGEQNAHLNVNAVTGGVNTFIY